jgi:hypothetical protein
MRFNLLNAKRTTDPVAAVCSSEQLNSRTQNKSPKPP